MRLRFLDPHGPVKARLAPYALPLVLAFFGSGPMREVVGPTAANIFFLLTMVAFSAFGLNAFRQRRPRAAEVVLGAAIEDPEDFGRMGHEVRGREARERRAHRALARDVNQPARVGGGPLGYTTNQLLTVYSALRVRRYEDTTSVADWGRPRKPCAKRWPWRRTWRMGGRGWRPF